MEPFTNLTAIAAPLPWANVNTDDIYPGPGASPVVRAGHGAVLRDRTKMGPNAFAAHRWNDDLSPRPDFVLNQTPFDTAGILIARENFGCGSSREMAVWCLQAIGIRCIIAPSFGDIFYNNCFKSGVLPAPVDAEEVEVLLTLAAGSADPTFAVDLEATTIRTSEGAVFTFQVGDYHRHALLNGLDEIAASLARMPAIEAHEARYYAVRPWLP
jgi:3-isopropylmalate/(R)-2-methylmalate dehydratase small subunit